MPDLLTETPEGLRIALRVTPRAARQGLGEVRDGRLQVKVNAAPEDGKATAAALKLVAEACDVPASRLELLSGHSSREKLLLIRGMTYSALPAAMQSLLSPLSDSS